ncbi:DNA-deoxyinosine glycosylase [Kaistella sp. G5-32]|uniref:DNA-deoxyinosine glycosylase n=1 Tax=Kaistella gelatinilytica TaxID=2787636 RepID=A0ABS0F951_9FLAO|nr:DNA-deoxyinosine glycosylase [Kaistella gelatinilytica]MBF8456212.1 DNA-deoxyinosine glycosylase [Kaistella gelatinilytica]
MADRISSFPPIISGTSKILILGSVPGIKSLELQEYYAHPQNKFWRILFELFQEDFTTDYSQKLTFLAKNHIAVWDVIDSCERDGSLDTKIKNEVHNDVEQILMDYPNIEAIFCNGQKSFKNVLKKLSGNSDIPIFALPSTSPAYTIPFKRKVEEWKIIKNFI